MEGTDVIATDADDAVITEPIKEDIEIVVDSEAVLTEGADATAADADGTIITEPTEGDIEVILDTEIGVAEGTNVEAIDTEATIVEGGDVVTIDADEAVVYDAE